MYKFLFIIIFLFHTTQVFCQETQITVIANGGLNLRSEPNTKSRKLTTIPYGSAIKIISEEAFGRDSVKVYYKHAKEGQWIKGNWRKAEYNKLIGYVLDIYIAGVPIEKHEFSDEFNDDFILLFPGCSCHTENMRNPKGWKWYGYFKQGDNQYTIEEIEISFYLTPEFTCEVLTIASKYKNLDFIIGSKKVDLAERGSITGKKLYTLLHLANDNISEIKPELEELSIEVVRKDKFGLQFYLKREGQNQLLDDPEHGPPSDIIFVGDIDGDSKDDYILQYGDKSGFILLYLSTKAKPRSLIGKAAVYFASYCC